MCRELRQNRDQVTRAVATMLNDQTLVSMYDEVGSQQTVLPVSGMRKVTFAIYANAVFTKRRF